MISSQAFRGGKESIQVPQSHQQLKDREMPWTAFFLKGWKTANGALGFPGRRNGVNRGNRGRGGLVSLRVGVQHTPALTSLSREVNCLVHKVCPLRGWGWWDANERILTTSSLFCWNLLLDGSELSNCQMTTKAPGKLQFSVHSIIKEEAGRSLPQNDLSTRKLV